MQSLAVHIFPQLAEAAPLPRVEEVSQSVPFGKRSLQTNLRLAGRPGRSARSALPLGPRTPVFSRKEKLALRLARESYKALSAYWRNS